MTEREAAKLIMTAWRRTQSMKAGKRFVARHIARFVLVGLYTGTRSAAICNAAIWPTVNRGYVDLEQGVFYQRPRGTRETTKLQPSVWLPDKLLAHMRRVGAARLLRALRCRVGGSAGATRLNAFRRIAEAAGLADATPHTLRYTAIT